MGADVVKIEDREGDQNHRWPPVLDGAGANFWRLIAVRNFCRDGVMRRAR